MTVFETGIDVSRYQGQINWPQVAAAGKQFAIVRVGSSNNNGVYVDPYFLQNVEGAHSVGMKVGAYYFTYAQTEEQVIRELQTYLAALEGLRLEYPVFVDVESNTLTGLGKDTLTGLVQFAMDILYQRGWYAGYYSYTNFANTYLDTSRLSAYPFWVADYRGYVGYKGSYDMWQYSSTGRVNGITGAVDLNYSYKNFLPIIKAGGFNGFGNQGPAMQPISGKTLEVFNARCEYFYTANLNDIVGYLPLGEYPALSISENEYQGYIWVTFRYGNEEYWTVLLSDRNRLVDTPDTECEEQLEQALQDLEQANAKIIKAAELARQAADLAGQASELADQAVDTLL
ncbi:MAG: glycoside hydrolase family 25 protein [Bacteroidales bacterium]|nr:glycoside hydrolase family 25 protein [Bacteroidales bacterium]